MTKRMVNRKFAKYAHLINKQKALEKEIEELKSEITSYMTEQGVSEVYSDEHHAIYKEISQSKIDVKRLREEKPRVAKQYTVESSYMRLTFR